MMTFKKYFLLIAAFFCCGILCSCGYHMGSMMHPQIKSIAFADIQNETKEPLLTEIIRRELAGQFQFDGSLRIAEKETADCILYMKIVNIKTGTIREESSDGQETYRPAEFGMEITADFTVIIPGRSEPLIPMRRISARSIYQYQADPQLGRINGLRQACFDLSRKAVQYTTEAW